MKMYKLILIVCVVFAVVDATFHQQCELSCPDDPSHGDQHQGPKGEKGEPTKSCNCSALAEVQVQLSSTEDELAKTNEELSKTKARMEILERQTDNLINHPRSCQDIPSKFHQIKNGSYLIQPNDSIQPFTVYCAFGETTVITSVDHNTEFELEVTCDGRRCHRHEIQYQATMPQMRSLIELVGNCRQFIKYRCHNSILFRNGGDVYSGWLSWNGKMQIYWGGANRQPNYCACGIAGNCADKNYKCNCDKNDNVEREDSGYLTFEDDLPVHTVYFGDTGGDSEYGFYTLGKLECMG